jgi:putative transposase
MGVHATLSQALRQRWSLDFVSRCLAARPRRILVVVEDCTRECPAAVADSWIAAHRVRALDALIAGAGAPEYQRPR